MKLTEKNIDEVVKVVKDNIGAEFNAETKLLYAFQTAVEWLKENKNANRR